MDTPSPSGQDTRSIDRLNDLVRDAGADPQGLSGKLVREVIHTAIKLIGDNADTGEMKLISRSIKELRYALKVFRPYQDARKVSIFGSARTAADHPDYHSAQQVGRAMVQHGWMVITGAGGGIMRAGQGGAGRASSFGVAIRLPFETTANEYIQGDAKLIVFRYFFTRKLLFVSQSHAVMLFPGGFGTQDECFETLTLIQTGKAPLVPIVMVDHPGGAYWKNWDQYVRQNLLHHQMISPEDLNLYMVTDDLSHAIQHTLQFYRNYHSQRFVRDDLVLRLQRPLTPNQVGQLNEAFHSLVGDGCIEQCGPLKGEQSHLDLPRLRFTFTRRDYGRLRSLINQINAMDQANHPNAPRSP